MALDTPSPNDVTQLLLDWRAGDDSALERLMPMVSAELHQRADRYMARERSGHTLQPTALVNEVYLRLVDEHKIPWQNRAHFFAIAARIMRRVLVDHARRRDAEKRGGDAVKVPLSEIAEAGPGGTEVDLIALDLALQELADGAPRPCRIVELRYFGGLSIRETAEVLGISPATVKTDWAMARAWLFRELQET